MFDWLWVLLLSLGILSIFTTLIWDKVKFSWLQNLVFWLVLSLPFERVPSIEIGGANVRISYVLVLVGFYFLSILIIKKDIFLERLKVSNFGYWTLAFWVSLLPSLFVAINQQKQIQALIATALVFGACFLIANFVQDVVKTLKWLIIMLFGVGLFGLFQFAADFVGVPYTITLLREHYTKRVFGFARIHTTALEPLYWGGMLLVPCVFLLLYLIFKNQKPVSLPSTQVVQNEEKILDHKKEINLESKNSSLTSIFNSKWFLLLGISVIYLNIILTLSRGAYLALGFSLLLCFALSFRFISFNSLLKWLTPYLVVVFSFVIIFISSTGSVALIDKATDHIVNVFSDRQFSTYERLNFLNDAFDLVYQNVIVGIGSGNYGPRVQNNVPQNDGSWLIVNNVYLEIWVEQGISALIIFISMMIYYLVKAVEKLWKYHKTYTRDELITVIALISGIIGYLVQWLTFSPIFIMPFFILFGLLINITNQDHANKQVTI